MNTRLSPPPQVETPDRTAAVPPSGQHSPELAAELNRLETEERATRDRERERELARLRELSRLD